LEIVLETAFQYITDSKGDISSIVLPIEFWRRINCDDETEYLLQSEENKNRLMEALNRKEFITKEDAYARLGI
jgi:PHD/YefM family antitoxin component YafN of YafNO toxin-antitoxin module